MYIAALIDLHPTWSQMAIFSVLGFGIVMFVLAVLSIVTGIFGKIFVAADKSKSSPKTASVQKVKNISEIENPDHAFVVSAAVAAVLPELQAENGELIAVLAAAATAALDDECRVVSVKLVPDMSYAMQGRQQIFESKHIVPVRFR